MTETYKSVLGFVGYEVGDEGSVFSAKRGRRRPLAVRVDADGYRRVELWQGGRRKAVGVHVLVLLAFVGPKPEGAEGAHEDGDPANNRVANLRWKTPKQNQADRVRHGTANRGSRHGAAKLDEKKVLAMREARDKGQRPRSLAGRFGVSLTTVYSATNGDLWKHVPAGV